jgi:hypothetical protein
MTRERIPQPDETKIVIIIPPGERPVGIPLPDGAQPVNEPDRGGGGGDGGDQGFGPGARGPSTTQIPGE